MSDWKDELGRAISKKSEEASREKKSEEETNARNETRLREIIIAALMEVKLELEKHGRIVRVDSNKSEATITVDFENKRELDLTIDSNFSTNERHTDRRTGRSFSGISSLFSGDVRTANARATKDDVARAVVSRYKNR